MRICILWYSDSVADMLYAFFFSYKIALHAIGVDLSFVYLLMGIIIGSAVIPLWNMMTWDKASGKGAVIAAWAGFFLAVIGWLVGAKIQSGRVSVSTLGTNEVMLSGNLIAILSSGFIHYVYSKFIDPQDFDFSQLDDNIKLVEQDLSGLGEEQRDKNELRRAKRWITRRGYLTAFVLIFVWPILSIPVQVFTESYFAFWVLISIAWGFGAAVVITVLPLSESWNYISRVLSGMYNSCLCKDAMKETAKDTENTETERIMETHHDT